MHQELFAQADQGLDGLRRVERFEIDSLEERRIALLIEVVQPETVHAPTESHVVIGLAVVAILSFLLAVLLHAGPALALLLVDLLIPLDLLVRVALDGFVLLALLLHGAALLLLHLLPAKEVVLALLLLLVLLLLLDALLLAADLLVLLLLDPLPLRLLLDLTLLLLSGVRLLLLLLTNGRPVLDLVPERAAQ